MLPAADPTAVTARLASPAQAADVLAALTEDSVDVAEFSVGTPSLDEVFFALTGRPAESRGAGGASHDHRRALPPASGLTRCSRTQARPRPASALSAVLTLAWRAMLKIKHVPFQLFDVTVTPIMFTLLFTYIFGGALAGSPREYIQYLLPGVLVQTIVFITVYTGVGLNTDIQKGLYDRFRSLPMWQPAPLFGALAGDLFRYSVASALILIMGLILGFRPRAGSWACSWRSGWC